MYYLFLGLLICFLIPMPSWAIFPETKAWPSDSRDQPELYAKGQILVRIDPNVEIAVQNQLEKELSIRRTRSFSLVKGLAVYKFDPIIDVMDMVGAISSKSYIIYAEPDYIYRVTAGEPVNDPEFQRQWALENIGQNSGKVDADINAESMWSIEKGSQDIVIGIIDTGIDFNHPDLVDNVWTNPLEVANNNVDDDRNGYVDDLHGINAIANNGHPQDDHVHGTHVAGTIGAKGNNGIGVSGVNQTIRMAACKFLSSSGSGNISDAIQCMEYFANLKNRTNSPVNIVATNNSWGGSSLSQAMLDAIIAHEKLGILFVAAAGNSASNNDFINTYPANYDVPNVISVAATDNNDRLATFSNYGKRTVHVAAPGVKILSTTLNGKYGELSGTSMAAPYVTGLAGIIAAHFRALSYSNIKNLIMAGGQRIDATMNKIISGRRIRGADINGVGSLSCQNQVISARIQPALSNYSVPVGNNLFLSAIHINCQSFAGPLTLWENDTASITLSDNGENGDAKAGDGIYSLNWVPKDAGIYQLRFSDTDTITIAVTQK